MVAAVISLYSFTFGCLTKGKALQVFVCSQKEDLEKKKQRERKKLLALFNKLV